MNQSEIQTKLDGMKKTRKALSIVTMVTAIVCMAVLLAYNFMSVTYLKSPVGTDYEQGFAFPGWQMIFYGFGRQFIMQDHLFDPNPYTIVGMLGTLIVLIVCTCRYQKGRNRQKANREFISAAFLVYSAMVLGAFLLPVATTAATSGGVYDFKNQYILNSASSFTKLPFANITCVVLLLGALVKIGNGAFLLYQKQFAAKYAPKKPKGDQ